MTLWTVTIEGEDFGQLDVPDGTRHYTGYENPGVAFFCPYCVRIWATILTPRRRTVASHHACQVCGTALEYPGSIWDDYSHPGWDQYLNEKIIRREADLAFKQLDQLTGEF